MYETVCGPTWRLSAERPGPVVALACITLAFVVTPTATMQSSLLKGPMAVTLHHSLSRSAPSRTKQLRTPTPTEETDHADDQPTGRADAMKGSTGEDVASWSAARSGTSALEFRRIQRSGGPSWASSRPSECSSGQSCTALSQVSLCPEEALQHVIRRCDEADYITYIIAVHAQLGSRPSSCRGRTCVVLTLAMSWRL